MEGGFLGCRGFAMGMQFKNWSAWSKSFWFPTCPTILVWISSVEMLVAQTPNQTVGKGFHAFWLAVSGKWVKNQYFDWFIQWNYPSIDKVPSWCFSGSSLKTRKTPSRVKKLVQWLEQPLLLYEKHIMATTDLNGLIIPPMMNHL